MSDSPIIEERRSALLGVKLKALLAEHTGSVVDATPEPLPKGSALLHDDAAWVLFDGDASRSLGRALAWAVRHGATTLDVIAESGGGTLARRAAGFAMPISVWFPDERMLLPSVAEPLASPPDVADDHVALSQLIIDAGAIPAIEHGVVFGEVRGLEVCRVVDQPTTGFLGEASDIAAASDDREPGVRLEVGVGAADREAFQMMHGDIPTVDALAVIVQKVAEHRSIGSLQHPLNRLAAARFLRWHAEQAPHTIGLTELAPAEPPVPRPNLKDPVPCVAAGVDVNGTATRVVFSSGVDLDLVPYVVDVQTASGQPVVVALAGRDLLGLTRDLAALLVTPIDFVSLD